MPTDLKSIRNLLRTLTASLEDITDQIADLANAGPGPTLDMEPGAIGLRTEALNPLLDWLSRGSRSFWWDDSVGGYEYWEKVFDNLLALTDGSANILNSEVERREYPGVSNLREAREALYRAFAWSDTEQGHAYWEGVVSALNIELAEREPTGEPQPDWLSPPEKTEANEKLLTRLLEWLDSPSASFDWTKSQRGAEYWDDAFNNLRAYVPSYSNFQDAAVFASAIADLDDYAQAMDALDEGLDWENSTEGSGYWEDVYGAIGEESREQGEEPRREVNALECDLLARWFVQGHRSFMWATSAYGEKYWEGVYDALFELAGDQRDAARGDDLLGLGLRGASDLLNNAFTWSDTKQGYGYWQKVYDRMEEEYDRR